MFNGSPFNSLPFNGAPVLIIPYEKTFVEILGCTDAGYKGVSSSRSDNIGIYDLIDRLWHIFRTPLERMRLDDIRSITSVKIIPEQFFLSDTKFESPLHVLTDITGISDIRTQLAIDYHTNIEPITTVDILDRKIDIYRLVYDIVGIIDTITKGTYLINDDTISVHDIICKDCIVPIADTISVVDVYNRVLTIYRQFSDPVSFIDTILKLGDKILVDISSITDTASLHLDIINTDIINIPDTITKDTYHVITNSLTTIDGIAKYISHIIRNIVTITDTLVKYNSIINLDTAGIVDIIRKHVIFQIPTNIVGIVDEILYTPTPIEISNIIKKIIHLGDIGGIW